MLVCRFYYPQTHVGRSLEWERAQLPLALIVSYICEVFSSSLQYVRPCCAHLSAPNLLQRFSSCLGGILLSHAINAILTSCIRAHFTVHFTEMHSIKKKVVLHWELIHIFPPKSERERWNAMLALQGGSKGELATLSLFYYSVLHTKANVTFLSLCICWDEEVIAVSTLWLLWRQWGFHTSFSHWPRLCMLSWHWSPLRALELHSSAFHLAFHWIQPIDVWFEW